MVLPRPPVSLKGRALRYLSAREHSRAELVRKLARHEEVPGELESVLDDLQAKGFISQERVVASVLNRRAAHMGAARVRQELNAKGIDSELVREALAGLRDSELERARAVWTKRFGGDMPVDARQWARQMRFLMARGFAGDVVRRVVPDAPR